jgi:hypothetical protein
MWSEQQAFLTLDRRWPIGRMARRADSTTPIRLFTPPLRVMAILAAAGVEAKQEWAALQEAVQRAGFPVALRVLVAEDELLERITNDHADGVDVTATYVPPGRLLFEDIRQFMPNVLHFFCHGDTEGDFAWLELATRSGWADAEDDAGIVKVQAQDFLNDLYIESVWIVTLNCCKGATDTASSRGPGSLVYSLVAHGFPAAAGMREEVTEEEAHEFCRGFYPALFELLRPVMTPGSQTTIEWACALYDPRRRLADLSGNVDPATTRRWTIPVLYTRPDPFVVSGRALDDDSDPLQRQYELLVLRRVLNEELGIPDEQLERLRRRIREIELQLYSEAGPVG